MPSFKTENALLLSVRPLGEKNYILSVLTKENGRYLGVIKTKKPPQIGSFCALRWQARLSEQLGHFYLDDVRSFYADFLDDKFRLYILSSLCALLNEVLPERQKAEPIYTLTLDFLDHFQEPSLMKRYALWEADLLKALGFGFDLTACAGGGSADDLAFISPKTGRAVSREKGLPYAHLLLPLPSFLCHREEKAEKLQVIQALALTGYFLTTHAGVHHLPPTREQLLYALQTGRMKSEML